MGASVTHAVLLSAGQGRRLSPLTDHKPKCLIGVGGRTILEWQLHALSACGVRDVTVVTGFEGHTIDAALKTVSVPLDAECLYNPFYAVADNIGSCWAARALIGEDTLLINGDTLFDPRILARVLDRAEAPISVTIDRKASYDSDDMKVQLDGAGLRRIGKTLTGPIDGESIGMLRFRGEGGGKFVERMAHLLRDPAALHLWYLSIIDDLAADGVVGTVSIEGLPWAEVDFPHDLPSAADQVGAFDWSNAPSPELRAARAGGNRP